MGSKGKAVRAKMAFGANRFATEVCVSALDGFDHVDPPRTRKNARDGLDYVERRKAVALAMFERQRRSAGAKLPAKAAVA